MSFSAHRFIGFLALLLAACQPVPRPFAPDAKQTPPAAALDISPRAGLVVDRIDGVGDDAQAAALRRNLVRALQARDVVAGVERGHRHSYWLQGELALAAAPADAGTEITVTGRWVLLRPDGTLQDEFSHRSRVSASDTGRPTVTALSDIAADAARAVEAAVTRWEVHDGRRLALPPLAIGGIDGAPGDGREALTEAMVQALGAAGIEVRDAPEGADYLLLGAVSLYPRPFGREQVDISWHVIRHDGSELGRIDQSNELPRGRLDGRWGLLAEDIARNATLGLVSLLQQASRQQAGK